MISGKSKISVLMANYNNSDYIEEAIDSVVNQTYEEWELVIVDDASTDDGLKVIERYKNDSRIKIFQNSKNIGYIRTLKKLIQIAEAPILGILDSDDALKISALEDVMNVYENNPDIGFVYTKLIFCDSNLKPSKNELGKKMPQNKSNIRSRYTSAFRTFRKKAYLKTSGLDKSMDYAEDRDLILKLEEVTKFYCVDKSLYLYRRSADTHTTNPEKADTGKINLATAKYNAFLRRQGTNIPNLTNCQMSSAFWRAFPSCIKLRDKEKFKYCFLKALKLCPLNVFGFLVFVARMIKFPFYRLMRFFKSDASKYIS